MYLELTDISKKIGADEVLSGITLSMERGKVYGLQGKNGCGKSMLMRVICGLVLPTVGEVKIDGKILEKSFHFLQVWACLLKNQAFWILTVDFKI